MNTPSKTPEPVIIAAISRVLDGNAAATLLLYHLIAYPYHTYNSDGLIIKRYKDMEAETGIKSFVCRKAAKLLERRGFIQSSTKQHNDVPIKHYLVNNIAVRDAIIKDLQLRTNTTNGDHHG